MKKIVSILTLFFLFIPYSNAIHWDKNNYIEKNNYKNNNIKATLSFKKFFLRKNPEKKSKIYWVLSFWDNLEILEFLNDNWLKIKVLSWKKENKIWYIKKRAITIQNIPIAKNIIKKREKKYLSWNNKFSLNNYSTSLSSDRNNWYQKTKYSNYDNDIDLENILNNVLKIFEEDEKNWKYKEKKWINKFNFYDYIFGWKQN